MHTRTHIQETHGHTQTHRGTGGGGGPDAALTDGRGGGGEGGGRGRRRSERAKERDKERHKERQSKQHVSRAVSPYRCCAGVESDPPCDAPAPLAADPSKHQACGVNLTARTSTAEGAPYMDDASHQRAP